jgi:transposase
LRQTGERFCRRIRQVVSLAEEWTEPLEGPIKCGETTFGAGARETRPGVAGKTFIWGLPQRNRLIRVLPSPGASTAPIRRPVRQQIEPGTPSCMDHLHAYASVAVRGNHVVVRKDKGRHYLNGIERPWR